MASTLLELAGFAALAAAAFLLGGLPACLIVAGVELLFVGYALSPLQVAPVRAKRAKRG